MSRRYVTDDLAIETNDDGTKLMLRHPLVPGDGREIFINKATIREAPGTRLTELALSNHGRMAQVVIEGLTAPSVLVALRDALVGIGLSNASQVVGRYHNELVRIITRERHGLTYDNISSSVLTSDIEGLMEAVDMARSEIVPCLIGASGIGKTEGIESFARKHGRKVVHLIASQVLPTEVSGMTMPNQETHAMDVFDHSRISHMQDGDILFLDELLKGQQQVLSACLTMVQERRLMSGTPLPDVIIVAAANPLASPKMLPVEIRQRFMFVEVSFDGKSWCEYMRGRGIPNPESVVNNLVTDHDRSDWNTLTPRTATKLLTWLDRTIGTDAHAMVAQTIRNMFDETVLGRLTACLYDARKEETRTPIGQATDRIRELMADLPEAEDAYQEIGRQKVKELLDDDMLSSRPDKVAELLGVIANMSGGSEILEALRSETVSLGEF